MEARRTSSIGLSSSNNSSNGSSLDNNLTVAYSEEEKKRLKKYGTDNLNISNMQLENSLLPLDEKRVLSPRKTLYYHENSNFSVSLRDKVLQKPSEVDRGSILMNISGDNTSAMILDDEVTRIKTRKTIINNDEMNLTLRNDSKPQTVGLSSVSLKPAVFKVPKSPAKPATPKIFQMTVAFENDMHYDSPPIKHPKLQDPKRTSEDFIYYLVSDTPTKNLCNNMCLLKKHKITPAQSPLNSKCARPTLDHRSLQLMSQLDTAGSGNDSIDLLKNMGLEFAPSASSQKKKPLDMSLETSSMELEAETDKRKSLFTTENVDETLTVARSSSRTSVRQTLFENSISTEEPEEISRVSSQQSRKTVYDDRMDMSMTTNLEQQPSKSSLGLESRKTVYEGRMDVSATQTKTTADMSFDTSVIHLESESQNRKSLSNDVKINETLIEPENIARISARQTFYDNEISIEDTAKISCQKSRKTIYDGNMDVSMAASSEQQQQKSFYSLDEGSTVDSKVHTLLNIKNIVQPEPPRQSAANNDASIRPDDPDTRKTSCSVLMNISNSTDILETTTELQAKANRLLQNPMATTASTSNLFTKSFQQDLDESVVSQKATPSHNSLPGEGRQRRTIYDANMSLNMSSATEPNHSTSNKFKKSSLVLRSMISMDDVNISGIEPTQDILIKSRKTVFDGSMEEETFKQPGVVKKRSPKPRDTILDSRPMDTSITEKKLPVARVATRTTTYNSEPVDETMVEGVVTPLMNRCKPRDTMLTDNFMDTSSINTKGPVTGASSRETTYRSDPIDATIVGFSESPVGLKGRITIYEDASIIEESIVDRQPAIVEEPKVAKPSAANFDVPMDEESTISSPTKISPIPQFHLSMGKQSSEEIAEMRKNLLKRDTKTEKARQTIYDEAAMEESTVTELEVPETRDVVNHLMLGSSAIGRPYLEVAKQDDDSEHYSMSPGALFPPPPGFQTPTLTDIPSFGGSKLVHSASPAEVLKLPSFGHCSQGRNTSKAAESTFIVKQRDDSRRLMNITDADLSLLDDESDPCVQESEISDRRSFRTSNDSSTSKYYEALQEFVNITLKNTSLSLGSSTDLPKAQNLDFSTSVDYCQLLEDQINHRKTLPIKPKLEIDTFLESLNIHPVVIPRMPQMQPDYLQKKLAATTEKHKRKLADQRAKWNAQLPAIPPGDFLMKNYIEW